MVKDRRLSLVSAIGCIWSTAVSPENNKFFVTCNLQYIVKLTCREPCVILLISTTNLDIHLTYSNWLIHPSCFVVLKDRRGATLPLISLVHKCRYNQSCGNTKGIPYNPAEYRKGVDPRTKGHSPTKGSSEGIDIILV
jgi:hypothetical protein